MTAALSVRVLLAWRPDDLELAASSLGTLRSQIEGAHVRTAETERAIPARWEGAAATAASGRLRVHVRMGERLAATLDLARRVLLAAADAIAAAQAVLVRAQQDAAEYQLTMTDAGEVLPPPARLLPSDASADLVAETRHRHRQQVEAAATIAITAQQALAAAAEADADAAHALDAAWDAAADGSTSDPEDRALWEAVLLRGVPPEGTDPDSVAAWWDSLSPEAQELLETRAWAEIGNLDGIPYPVRISANRLAISAAMADELRNDAALNAEIGDLERRIAEIEASGRRDRSTLAALAALQSELRGARAEHGESRAMSAWLQELLGPTTQVSSDGSFGPGAGRQVVLFDLAGGRFAEVVGDLSSATNVGVFVPGTGAGVGPGDGSFARAEGFVERAVPPGSLAVVTFIGGPMPQHILQDSTRNSFADDIGPVLARFVSGIDHVPGATVTALGHSYGGSVVGAAELAGMRVDRVLHVESAGIGPGVDDIGDLPRPETPRYSMTAPGDPIALSQGMHVGPIGHGADPDTFTDVTRLETGRIDDADTSSPLLHGSSAHSAVFEHGSTSWNNMLAVMTGQDVSLYVEPILTTTPQGLTIHTDYPMEDPMFEPERAPVR